MGIEHSIQIFIEMLVQVARVVHFPLMFTTLALGLGLRSLIYYTINRHAWFAKEFEKRVGRFLYSEMGQKSNTASFYVVTKKLLERTFYEVFENREKLKRRKPDGVMLLSDRIFLIKQGCAWFVHDILKQIRFLKYGQQPPKLENITKNTFAKNPAFNKIFGIIPIAATNDFLNILPGLFVIGGIFGTFLGVMKGLPELSGMDLNDPEKTKMIMDEFLTLISISMGASVTGIFFSVIQTLFNVSLSPERSYGDIIERFENSLDLLWNYAHSNEVPTGMKQFDENRDALEALAENAINFEIDKIKNVRDIDFDQKKKTVS